MFEPEELGRKALVQVDSRVVGLNLMGDLELSQEVVDQMLEKERPNHLPAYHRRNISAWALGVRSLLHRCSNR